MKDKEYQKEVARGLFIEARGAFEEGDANYAIECLNEALEYWPNFLPAVIQLGIVYLQAKEDFDKALKFFLKANKIDSNNRDVYYFLGEVYSKLYRIEDAVTCYETFLKIPFRKRIHHLGKECEIDARKKLQELQKELEKQMIKQLEIEEKRKRIKEKKEALRMQLQEEEKLRTLFEDLSISKKIVFDDRKANLLLENVRNKLFEPFELYELKIEATKLNLFKGFDKLLCLNYINNVENLWYQIETVKKTLRDFKGRVLLCDEVGLGKTIEAGMILKEYLLRGLVKKVLVLTPPALVMQWYYEMLTKFNLKFFTTEDDEYKKNNKTFWKRYDLIIASINIAKSKTNFDIITDVDYDLLIIDEAHHLKNRNTLNWKLVNTIKKRFILLLTATPVHNNLQELYNLITLLKPGQLKTLTYFKKEFITKGDARMPKNRETLRELLSDVMIRNTRSIANINLPKRYAHTIQLNLTDEEKLFYDKLTEFVRFCHTKNLFNRFTLSLLQAEAGSSYKACIDTLQNIISKNELGKEVKDKITELFQLSYHIKINSKLNKLIDIISSNEEKIVVFTNYISTQELIAKKLNELNIKYSLFNGRLTTEQKNESIDLFQRENKILLSTEIGGEGKNLHFCNTIVNYDLPWNPMRIEQRIGRLHRIGQKRNVFIFNLSAKGTLEDYLLYILDKKINMFELVIGEIDMILGHLDYDEEFEEIIMNIWLNSADDAQRREKFDELANKLILAKEKYIEIKEYGDELFHRDYEL